MGRTQTEIPGFAENVRQGLRRVRDELRKAGHSPDEIDAILKAQIEKTLELNARRGELKRELLSVTASLRGEFRKTDWMASGYLDAAMGAVGKGSDDAKNLRRLRSRIRMPATDNGTGQPPQT